MKLMLYIFTANSMMLVFPLLERCGEEVVEISKAQVSAVVLETLENKFPGIVVDEYVRESEEGEVHYAFAFQHEGLPSEATFSENGRLLELEQEIAFVQLPAVIQDSLRHKFGDIVLLKAERVFAGADSFYEIKFRQRQVDEREEQEVRFSEDGRFINYED